MKKTVRVIALIMAGLFVLTVCFAVFGILFGLF